MTIKPAAKRAPPDSDGKIENPNGGGVTGDSNNGQQKSPQRRELYEDLSRHRCSPNKSRSKRRDHLHEHHKRERSERSDWNKHADAVANSTAAGTRSLGVGNMLLTNSTGLTLAPNLNVGSVAGGVVVGRNSPGMSGDVTSSGAAVNMLAVGTGSTGGNNAVSMTNVGGNSGVGVGVVGTLSPTHGCTTAATSTAGIGGSVASSDSTVAMLQGGGIASHGLKSVEESCSGYNSGDEHMPPKEKTVSAAEWKRRDEQFVRVMSEAGFELRQVEEDGACLFRAISLQIYGDEDAHEIVRQHTMDYIYKNREYFSQFVTEDINSYITRKRRKDSHGNHIEIQAMSEIYARPVEVYCYKSKPINIFNSEQNRNGYAPLRLSYQRMSHYNAIIDPYNATVGVGLGIANYHPKMQTSEAMRMSEQLEIEQTMFEDKLKTTDWEATNEVIEEQVARESYFQWCRENLQKNRVAAVRSATATVTSAQACNNNTNNNSDINSTQDEEVASPSKYALDNSSGGSGNNSSNCSSGHSPESSEGSSSSAAGGGGHGVANVSVPPSVLSATRKLNFLMEKQSVSAAVGAGGIENSAGAASSLPTNATASPGPTSSTTTKKLSALAKLQKEVSAGGYDTDDTDISTNSSLTEGTSIGTACGGGGGGGDSPQQQTTTVRPKKIKTRYISKKRRHEQLMRHGDGSDDNTHNVSGGGNASGLDGSSNSGSSSDATPRVHKGAKRDNNTMEPTAPLSSVVVSAQSENLSETKLEELPCSSKCAQQPIVANADVGGGGGGSMDTSAPVAPLSSFYQDLLESSYDTDGFGQLTEAEMLQRAIQLSTQDFIEHQKRKYLFRP